MGKEPVDMDLAIDNKARAVGLALPGKGPRPDDRQLLAQHVRADVDRHIVALADKATVPQTLALRTAAIRPSGWLEVSRVKSAPPWVRSLIVPTGSFERGFTVSQAPNSLARGNRLEIEAMVQNRDIGFVRAGQSAEVKVDTFNFTKTGYCTAPS
jgi:hypothetical protein